MSHSHPRHLDERPIRRKVDVNDDVAKRHDVSPFDLGVARPKRLGQPRRSFPDDRQFVQDGAAQQVVRDERMLLGFEKESADGVRGLKHVGEVEFLTPHRSLPRPKAPVFLFSASVHPGEPGPPCGG